MGPFPNAHDRVSNITPKAGYQGLGELHTTARLEIPLLMVVYLVYRAGLGCRSYMHYNCVFRQRCRPLKKLHSLCRNFPTCRIASEYRWPTFSADAWCEHGGEAGSLSAAVPCDGSALEPVLSIFPLLKRSKYANALG